MTFDELEDWAMRVGEYDDGVFVGKNLSLMTVKQTVQKLLVEYESTMNDRDGLEDSVYELQDALERGCD